MDIAALSVSMSASRLSTNMGIALLSKVLDTAEETGVEFLHKKRKKERPSIGPPFFFPLISKCPL